MAVTVSDKKLMAISDVLQPGEYGATLAQVTRDGSLTRLAFGRNGSDGEIYYLAVLLSDEARQSLLEQLSDGAR